MSRLVQQVSTVTSDGHGVAVAFVDVGRRDGDIGRDIGGDGVYNASLQ